MDAHLHVEETEHKSNERPVVVQKGGGVYKEKAEGHQKKKKKTNPLAGWPLFWFYGSQSFGQWAPYLIPWLY